MIAAGTHVQPDGSWFDHLDGASKIVDTCYSKYLLFFVCYTIVMQPLRILILFYSFTGATAKLADCVAAGAAMQPNVQVLVLISFSIGIFLVLM